MSGVPYHAWTHRPKAQGGTDPVVFDIPTAAFMFGLPIAADPLGEQRLEDISTWTSLLIDPDFALNRDRLTDADAVRLETSSDGLGSRMVFETAGTLTVPQLQYWVVGAWVNIGGEGADEVFDTDTTLQMHHISIKLCDEPGVSGFRNQQSMTMIPAASGKYHFGETSGVQLHVSALLDPSEVTHDPLDAEADQDGLVLQAWHNLAWVDDAGAGKGPPTVKYGQVWGFRYTIGLYDF